MAKFCTSLSLSFALLATTLSYAQVERDPWAAWRAKDYATAIAGFKELAEKGDIKAQERLGWMYKNAEGTPKDDAQSVAYFRKAADQGNLPSQAELGWILRDGRGVAKDDVQAVEWFRKAAENGNASAQYGMGLSYVSGRGIPKDEQQALGWYEKAALQGHARARENLDAMKSKAQSDAKDEAIAPQLFAKNHKLGTNWEWKQFDTRTKIEIARDSRSVIDDNGKLMFSDGKRNFANYAIDRSAKPFRMWPLEVGKTWEFEKGTLKQNVNVVAFESVEVPAGKFMAFKIVHKGYFTNSFGSHPITETYWYSPEIGAEVKYVIEERDHSKFETRELVRYQ